MFPQSEFTIRVTHAFAHLGVAIALGFVGATIAHVYGANMQLAFPLPPYPLNRIVTLGGLAHA